MLAVLSKKWGRLAQFFNELVDECIVRFKDPDDFSNIFNASTQRYLYDWQTKPMTTANWEDFSWYYQDSYEMDNILKRLTSCPSIKALELYCSDITKVAFSFSTFMGESEKILGCYWGNKVELRALRCAPHLIDVHIGNAGHELRHKWHDDEGFLNLEKVDLLSAMIMLLSFEADASAYMITIALEKYDCEGDKTIIDAFFNLERYALPMQAAWACYQADNDSLWDGRVSAAAFRSYLDDADFGRRDFYGRTVIDHYLKEMHVDDFVAFTINGSEKFEYLRNNIFTMPYIDNKGKLVERPFYQALINEITYEHLFESLSLPMQAQGQFFQGISQAISQSNCTRLLGRAEAVPIIPGFPPFAL